MDQEYTESGRAPGRIGEKSAHIVQAGRNAGTSSDCLLFLLRDSKGVGGGLCSHGAGEKYTGSETDTGGDPYERV